MGESRMSDENIKPHDEAARGSAATSRMLSARSVRLAAFILVSQLVMTMAGWGYLKVTTPEIVVFDMKGTIDLFKEQSARQSLDEEKAQRLTRRFNTALTDSLGDWQSSHNAILLVKPAVISEQTDITQEIRADIARRMQEGQ